MVVGWRRTLFTLLLGAGLWLVAIPDSASGYTIEGVSGPEHGGQAGVIRRSSLYRDDAGRVWYGRCGVLESRCTPDSKSLKLERYLSYEDYQTRLASLFRIDPKYLIHHEKTRENYDRLLVTLQGIVENPNTDRSEREKAKSKIAAIKAPEGPRDRFLQAVAIKESLDRVSAATGEELVVTIDKSERQYRESLWPMNFATYVKAPQHPRRIYDPSTDLIWYFVTESATRKQAQSECETLARGARLPSHGEIEAASAWLAKSPIAEAIPPTEGQHTQTFEKKLWLLHARTIRRDAGEREEQERYRTYTRTVWVHDCAFSYAYLREKSSPVFEYIVKTQEEREIDDPIAFCGSDTVPLSVVCVQDANAIDADAWEVFQ